MQSFKMDLTKIETDQIHNHFKKFAKYEIQRDKLLLKLEELGEISDDKSYFNWIYSKLKYAKITLRGDQIPFYYFDNKQLNKYRPIPKDKKINIAPRPVK